MFLFHNYRHFGPTINMLTIESCPAAADLYPDWMDLMGHYQN